MQIWGTLSSRFERWPAVGDYFAYYQGVRCIAKGEVRTLLQRRDARLLKYFDRLERAGCRVYIDLPGARLQIAKTVPSVDLFRAGAADLVDEKLVRRSHEVPVSGLSSCGRSLRVGAAVSIADGAVSGTILQVFDRGFRMSVQGNDRIDLMSRSMAISGISPCSEAPTQEELELVAALTRWGIPVTGFLLSFSEVPAQLSSLREVSDRNYEIVPKIETKTGVENAGELAAFEGGYVVIGRSDLLVEVGACALVPSVTRAVTAVRRAGGRAIVASGIAVSLLRRADFDITDLSDIAYLRFIRAAGVMISGSVSELRFAQAGEQLQALCLRMSD